MDEKQLSAVNLVQQGHNLFLTGCPGTRKTFTLSKIVERLQVCGKNVCLTGSTGKAASVLKENIPDLDTTVTTNHRFCGLLDGRYPNEQLLVLLQENDFFRPKNKILNADVVIIYEISMISCKTFNQIEYIFRMLRQKKQPFGGIQMILAGRDLTQLPPVPNLEYNDDGSLFVTSTLMDNFHVIRLHTVQRQEEVDYIQAIHDVARLVIKLICKCVCVFLLVEI